MLRWQEGMRNWDVDLWKCVFLATETKKDVARSWCGLLHDKTYFKMGNY